MMYFCLNKKLYSKYTYIVYTYIYIERESKRVCVYIYICLCMYVCILYMYMRIDYNFYISKLFAMNHYPSWIQINALFSQWYIGNPRGIVRGRRVALRFNYIGCSLRRGVHVQTHWWTCILYCFLQFFLLLYKVALGGEGQEQLM